MSSISYTKSIYDKTAYSLREILFDELKLNTDNIRASVTNCVYGSMKCANLRMQSAEVSVKCDVCNMHLA